MRSRRAVGGSPLQPDASATSRSDEINVLALVRDPIVGALEALQREGELPAGLDPLGIEIVPPRDEAHGDFTCNAGLVLARSAGISPRDLAGRLAVKLRRCADFDTVEAAGPGFLNLRLAPRVWHRVLGMILEAGPAYGRTGLSGGGRLNATYIVADPTRPLSLRHGRAAVLADALARMLAFTGHADARNPTQGADGGTADAVAASAVAQDLRALGIALDERFVHRAAAAGREEIEAAVAALHGKAGGCPQLFVVLGADCAGYALAGGGGSPVIKLCDPVEVHRPCAGMRPARARGASAALRAVVDEVGRDAVRFAMLPCRSDVPLVLHLGQVLEQSRNNPAFNVPYAHARAKSVFRNALPIFPALHEGAKKVVGSDLSLLAEPGDLLLIKKLARFPASVEAATRACEPHGLVGYLYDLASSFLDRYAVGNESPHLRFIQPTDGKLTAARLALVQASAQVLAVGLELLGVLAPFEMG